MKKITVRRKRQEQIAEVMSPRAARKFAHNADNALIDFEEQVTERFEYAQGILKIQNEAVHKIVNAMVEQMQRMAGEPRFVYEGATIPVDADKLRDLQEKNFIWVAVRLLAACATFDIQISGFKLPEYLCAKCGKGVKPPVKKQRS